MMSCCSKIICSGCVYANMIQHFIERLNSSCPFCREPKRKTEEECVKRRMNRREKNDPVAFCHEGREQYKKANYSGVFKYFATAAELGVAEAHFQLSLLYRFRHGVEEDRGKEIYHLEEAAIGGHFKARNNLGWLERSNGNTDRAVKHSFIAAGCRAETCSINRSADGLVQGGKYGERRPCCYSPCTSDSGRCNEDSTEGRRRSILSIEGIMHVQ